MSESSTVRDEITMALTIYNTHLHFVHAMTMMTPYK